MDTTQRFEGRTLMVTGGAGNIGLETARRLAREGARVALVDVAEEKLEQAAADLRAEGGEVRISASVTVVTNRPAGVEITRKSTTRRAAKNVWMMLTE